MRDRTSLGIRAGFWIGVLCCLSAHVPAQVHDSVSTVRGTVVDEAGDPVAGARVELVLAPTAENKLLFERLMEREPPPRTRSNDAGEFVLALLPAHLYLGELQFIAIGLEVRKDGYQCWRTPVVRPLRLYRGSHVQLRKLRPGDHARVVVENPEPGMRVRVRRYGESYLEAFGELPPEESWYDVAPSGELDVVVPVLPSPVVLPLSLDAVLLRHDVELWTAAGRTPAQAIAPGREVRLRAASAEPIDAEAEDDQGDAGPYGAVRFRIRDDAGDPVPGVLVSVSRSVPDSRLLHRWLPADPSRWFTDEQGTVDWDRVPVGMIFPQATRPGWMPIELGQSGRDVWSGGVVEFELQLSRAEDYEVHVRDGAKRPVPFAQLKHERWTYRPDGSSQGGMFHFRGDSLGVVRFRKPEIEAVELQHNDPRVREGRGTPVAPGRSELTVPSQPLVLLRTPVGEEIQHRSLPRAQGSSGPWDTSGAGILWRGYATVAFGMPGSPPVVWAAPRDLEELEGQALIEADRSRIVRRIPLELSGVDGVDLSGLQAVPIAVELQRYIEPLVSNMVARGDDGRWMLVSRDGYQHECRLMHPAFVMKRVRIPPADEEDADKVRIVTLTKGTPVEIRFSVAEELHELDFPRLWVGRARDQTEGTRQELYGGFMPLTDEQRAGREFTVAMPSALVPGSYRIGVQGMQGRAEVEVAVGEEKLELDLGELRW